MDRKERTILITGAAGLLGSYFVDYFSERAKQVIAIYSHNIVPSQKRNVLKYQLDLSDFTSISKLFEAFKLDVVIHCAGITHVERCEEKPDLAFLINAEATKYLAHCTHLLGSKFIYISTDHLFSGLEAYCAETTMPSPINVYAQSKLLGEKYALLENDKSLILRTNFFGKSLAVKQSFSDWVWQILGSDEKINGFNDVFFSPISMHDLAYYLERMLNRQAVGIYNLCGSERISKFDFIVEFAKYFDFNLDKIKSISIQDSTIHVKRPLDMSLSTHKISSFLGETMPNISSAFKSIEKDYLPDLLDMSVS